jgi:hypothetical protein
MALLVVRGVRLKPAEGLTSVIRRLGAACAPWTDRPMFKEIRATADALNTHLESTPS